MSLRSTTAVLATLALSISAGCAVSPQAPLKPETFFGNYVLRSDDPGIRCDPDRLTLRADGTYTLLHVPNGRRGQEEQGTWRLVEGVRQEILVGDTGFPIEFKGQSVRLIRNYDRGEYYEKTGS